MKIVHPQFHYNRFNGFISTPKIYQHNCEHNVKREIIFLLYQRIAVIFSRITYTLEHTRRFIKIL